MLNGRVLFDSEARIDLPPQQRRVGYLFQNYALFPTMTVEKNILCGICSGSKAEKAVALSATLHRFRLEGLEKRYPAQRFQRTAAAGWRWQGILCCPAGGHFAGRAGFPRWTVI